MRWRGVGREGASCDGASAVGRLARSDGGMCVLGLSSAVSKVEQAVRPRHVGIGFVWAWIYCAFSTSALYAGRTGSSINADASWLASAIAVSVCLFALAFAWRRADMARVRPLAYVGAVLMAAGTFCSGAFSLPEWASATCGVASGVGSALLILFWGDALSRIETERVEIAIPAASGVMLACVFVFPYIQGLPGALGVTSLPLLSLACLYLTWADIDAGKYVVCDGDSGAQFGLWRKRDGQDVKRETGERGRESGEGAAFASGPYAFLARISIVLFAAYFAIGAASAMGGAIDAFQDAYGFDAGTLIGSLCGIGFAFWFIFFSPRLNVAALLRWVSPILMVGLAAMSFSGVLPEFATSVSMSVSDTVLQVIAFLSFVNLARARVFSPAFAVGVGQGMTQLGVLVGNVFGNWSLSNIAAGDLQLWCVAMFSMCVLSIAMAAAPSDRHMGGLNYRGEEVGACAPPSGSSICQPAPVPHAAASASTHELDERAPIGSNETRVCEPASAALPSEVPILAGTLDGKVARIAAAAGLSARETEVLGYLARGRSQPYIRDVLVLSKNTVASHVKHIYQKLDVHSRQELLDLFAG